MAEKDNAFPDEVVEEEAEQTFTIEEYLDSVEADEMEADLVLGGDEGNECTYTKGYLKRQAIFSCLTCTPEGNAGVCTACSLSCHDGHEVVELWTKRNFRCDCGNSKFGEFFCKLFPGKDAENVENSYNHNFKGLYCTCARPYPDPDTEEQVDMIQCCICEDWFHEEHIGLESADEIPRDEEGEPQYEEFICQACSSSCSFLTLYPKSVLAAGGQYSATENPSKGAGGQYSATENPSKGAGGQYSATENPSKGAGGQYSVTENPRKDKAVPKDTSLACASGKLSNENCDRDFSIKNHVVAVTSESVTGVKNLQPSDIPGKDVASTDISSNGICIIGAHVEVNLPSLGVSKPMFLYKSWRDALCRCVRCIELYRQNNVSFLVDKEDSIVEYLKMAKQRREDKLQQEESANLNMFNNLGHVEKIEILNGIEQIKDGLLAFMESSDPSKPVTPADIQEIFENLAKRRRLG